MSAFCHLIPRPHSPWWILLFVHHFLSLWFHYTPSKKKKVMNDYIVISIQVLTYAYYFNPHSNNILDVLQTFTRSAVLDFTGKKLALWFYCTQVCGWALPPYIHLASTRRHSRDRCFQAFPVFHHSSTSVYYTEHKPKTKKGGRPGSEATSCVSTKLSDINTQISSMAIYPASQP